MTKFALALAPLGWAYGALMRTRRALYRAGVLASIRMPVAVISVGNLTLGGTGKTPFTAYLASLLRAQGQQVAVLSRGYGRRGRGLVVVSQGSGPTVSWEEAGDEPYLLACRLPKVPVIVSRNRVEAARIARQKFARDVLILDDGFQHLALQRDLDLVLIDSTRPFGNGRVVPAGVLREPPSTLRWADLLVLTRTDQVATTAPLRALLHRNYPHIPLMETVLRPEAVTCLDQAITLAPEGLANKRLVTLAGIANPGAFEQVILNLGAEIVQRVRFRDHHPFRTVELRQVIEAALRYRAAAVITTEKDAVRLAGRWPGGCPLWVLRMTFQIRAGAERLQRALERIFTV